MDSYPPYLTMVNGNPSHYLAITQTAPSDFSIIQKLTVHQQWNSAIASGHLPGFALHLSENADHCAICTEKPSSQRAGGLQHRGVQLKCGHVFGSSCLQTWFLEYRKATCPYCRDEPPATDALLRLRRAWEECLVLVRADEEREMTFERRVTCNEMRYIEVTREAKVSRYRLSWLAAATYEDELRVEVESRSEIARLDARWWLLLDICQRGAWPEYMWTDRQAREAREARQRRV